MCCSTARNSKALLKAAIRSDNPVIFFEHVLLYNVKGPVGDKDEVQELNRAEIVRAGSDITILCYSRMRYVSMQAVGELVTQGYDPEVIDLISLKPFDLETIYNSIKKTRKVLIVEECMRTGGIGASLSSTIGENFIDELDHEVVRLSSQDVPTAYVLTQPTLSLSFPLFRSDKMRLNLTIRWLARFSSQLRARAGGCDYCAAGASHRSRAQNVRRRDASLSNPPTPPETLHPRARKQGKERSGSCQGPTEDGRTDESKAGVIFEERKKTKFSPGTKCVTYF